MSGVSYLSNNARRLIELRPIRPCHLRKVIVFGATLYKKLNYITKR